MGDHGIMRSGNDSPHTLDFFLQLLCDAIGCSEWASLGRIKEEMGPRRENETGSTARPRQLVNQVIFNHNKNIKKPFCSRKNNMIHQLGAMCALLGLVPWAFVRTTLCLMISFPFPF